ncbi:MAG: iron-containing alcohol dehydrogenase family protein [Eubacterium sp.]
MDKKKNRAHKEMMHMTWNYIQPVNIKFGNGALSELPQVIAGTGGKRGILITSASQITNGTAQRIQELAGGKIKAFYSGVRPNPDIQECQKAVTLIQADDVDFVIAAGGGSTLDTAKAAAVFSQGDQSAEFYYHNPERIPKKKIPLIAVPATAGTGSEVTSVSVLSDRAEETKKSIGKPQFYPDYALVDPELTWTVPEHVTLSTGMDVFCHALEGFWSIHHQPVCDLYAVRALKLVLEYLPRLQADLHDHEAREKLSEASLLAGLAFALPKTTAPHACSFPLTMRLGIPHGEACALTIPEFLLLNASADKAGRIQGLIHELGMNSPEELAEHIREFQRKSGLCSGLRSYRLSDSDIHNLAAESMLPNIYNNPVPVGAEDVEKILRKLS